MWHWQFCFKIQFFLFLITSGFPLLQHSLALKSLNLKKIFLCANSEWWFFVFVNLYLWLPLPFLYFSLSRKSELKIWRWMRHKRGFENETYYYFFSALQFTKASSNSNDSSNHRVKWAEKYLFCCHFSLTLELSGHWVSKCWNRTQICLFWSWTSLAFQDLVHFTPEHLAQDFLLLGRVIPTAFDS